jgi:putative holliday junction resolvase
MDTIDAKTYLGIDYGSTNIGIALGRNGLVVPLKIISGKNDNVAIHEINRTICENHVEKIVVGLPLDHLGKETKQSLETRHFVKMLKIFSKKPVDLYDENNTSNEALQEAINTGISRKSRGLKDHLSAALILKRYYQNVEEKK